jgi:hypothetical protein
MRGITPRWEKGMADHELAEMLMPLGRWSLANMQR